MLGELGYFEDESQGALWRWWVMVYRDRWARRLEAVAPILCLRGPLKYAMVCRAFP
jgi:hypothetical protein